jgi:2-haloacid dehalogenase
MEKPKAVLFDAYGTLFDVYSVGLLAEQLFAGQGQALSVLWRDKQIEYTRLVTTSSHGAHYQPFWALTQAALRYSCKKLGLVLTPAHEHQLMNQYRHLSAFPENREVLQALKANGIVTGILSNGDPDMLGVHWPRPGMDFARSGSTATSCRLKSWARNPRVQAPTCATHFRFSEFPRRKP